MIKGQLDKTIVISAHYDHLGYDVKNKDIFYGADDNASGIVAMFLMMKWFSENKPKYNLLFACFDGEEQFEYPDGSVTDLLGSTQFV